MHILTGVRPISQHRILVVGGSGRIGRIVRRAWSQTPPLNIEVVFQTRTPNGGDLMWDPLAGDVAPVRAAGRFDAMLVLSGIVPKPDADFRLNSDIGLACGAAAADCGIRRVLLASTSAVYGAALARPYGEGDPCTPVNQYGRSKLEMEAACLAQARELGFDLCCLRIGNVAGADALLLNGRGLHGEARLKLDRFSDGGTPLRSYIGPATLAAVLAHLVAQASPPGSALNIAAPTPISMGDLVKAAQIPFELRAAPASAHQLVTLDCGRLAETYPFTPRDSDPSEMVSQWQQLRDLI